MGSNFVYSTIYKRGKQKPLEDNGFFNMYRRGHLPDLQH
jgi:hypothetical protein